MRVLAYHNSLVLALLWSFSAVGDSEDERKDVPFSSLAKSCGCGAAPPGKGSKQHFVSRNSQLPPRPNIIFLISDDVDREWLGRYRSIETQQTTELHQTIESMTPHLDRLAHNGVLFTRAYTAASTCAPSRYALLTGRWPSRAPSTATFVKEVVPNVKLPDDCESHHRVNGTTIDPAETNLALELRSLGYHTSYIGKWHCSSEIALMHSPLRDRKALYSWMRDQVKSRGFDEAEGLYFTNVPQLRSKLGGDVHHHQEWLTELSVDYIHRRARRGQQLRKMTESSDNIDPKEGVSGTTSVKVGEREPFFLVMASTLPHGPNLHLWPRANETLRTVNGEEWGSDSLMLEDLRRRRREAHRKCEGFELANGFQRLVQYRHPSIRWLVQYIPLKGNECAKMVLFDDAVGRIVGALKDTGQLKDTLIVYTTDHGWTDKGFAYEGASHVPLIMHWPRIFSPGSDTSPDTSPGDGIVLSQLVSTIDIAATAVEAASRGRLLDSLSPEADRNSEENDYNEFNDNRHDIDGMASMDGKSLLHLLIPQLSPEDVATSRYSREILLHPGQRKHRDFAFIANGWNRAVVSTVNSASRGSRSARGTPTVAGNEGSLKLMRNFFPRSLNRQWSREAGGVRINPYFGSGCVHDWWATAVVKHGNFFDRHQFFDLDSDRLEQRSLYRSLKPPGLKKENERPVHPLSEALDEMFERLLEHTKRTKQCSEVCAISLFDETFRSQVNSLKYVANAQIAMRNRALHLAYIDVLNGRNDSRNFLTNWFTWTERYRSNSK